MPLTDRQGKPWAIYTNIKAGDRLKADGGFDCLAKGQISQVERDDSGLFIRCEDGRHYLSGQLGDDDELIGLYPT